MTKDNSNATLPPRIPTDPQLGRAIALLTSIIYPGLGPQTTVELKQLLGALPCPQEVDNWKDALMRLRKDSAGDAPPKKHSQPPKPLVRNNELLTPPVKHQTRTPPPEKKPPPKPSVAPREPLQEWSKCRCGAKIRPWEEEVHLKTQSHLEALRYEPPPKKPNKKQKTKAAPKGGKQKTKATPKGGDAWYFVYRS